MPEKTQNPIVPNVTPITPGSQTSEGRMAAAAQRVATVIVALAAASASIQPFIDSQQDNTWGIVAAAAVAVIGIIAKTLIALGYAKVRGDVKTSPNTR